MFGTSCWYILSTGSFDLSTFFLVNRIVFFFFGQNDSPCSVAHAAARFSASCMQLYIVRMQMPVINKVPSSGKPMLVISELSYSLRKSSKTIFHDIMVLRTPHCGQHLPGLIEAFDSLSDKVTVRVFRKWLYHPIILQPMPLLFMAVVMELCKTLSKA
jgi:hypothetical protein